MIEGKNDDWYEEDGKIIICCRLKEGDKVIIERPNFAEVHYDFDDLYIECSRSCETVIPARMYTCGPCSREHLGMQIVFVEGQIETSKLNLNRLQVELEEKDKAWKDYLERGRMADLPTKKE